MSLSSSNISSDLSNLLSLPPSTLSTLLDPPPSSIRPTSEDQSPIQVLSAFSPSQATPEQSQTLIKCYITQMNEAKTLERGGEIDKLGERIDTLRERGGGLEGTLSEVKVKV
ncbi:hypothetical protein I302_101359 [Kwoniella bestiolae CBS 10118]|uniref:Uncharacterized protein n=1 Tax=Kwoniella bestiolae CBS 10118 TaxID=1296100 RepID=A0A1B9GC29_9TREE|nr:hypothetical protein I302_00042 [Kwoniella bestiolae CBS 10118]OCF28554.1 hypothetical protein I302_00042 [Kwoniella bestiolae CBS 10118]